MEQKTATKYFYDTHPTDAWCMKFAVLFLPTSHRKILNRRPEVYNLIFRNKLYTGIVIDFKVLSN